MVAGERVEGVVIDLVPGGTLQGVVVHQGSGEPAERGQIQLFSDRLKRNGQVARALASYNAGDGNVDNWTLPGRDDPDVFTEFIPFAETHDYVKKILGYWWINRYLYAR